ncbi:putative disease resistance protein [Vitis vinifera]|uniref:Putative disease resistance protein n=1 Tax=Vitis vinifera TaxID=29760 RepID=A0A438FXA4_VITVI|nr:putative disease resistance protein [Vitis vinifera]
MGGSICSVSGICRRRHYIFSSTYTKAAEIASKECDGLPLALITIGRAMAGTKTPEEWEKKIQMLKNYPAKFPGFLDEYGDIKEARNGGEDIIASLNHACLLEITVTDNIWTQARCRCVKMHDVIRDMALWLACQNGNKKQNKFVVVDKGELVNAQEVEKWKGTPRLSFLFSIMNSDEATHEDCRALLVELEGLKCMGEVSISLDSVLAIQTLLELPQVTKEFEVRNCSNLEDVTFQFGKGSPFNIPKASILIPSCSLIEVDESGVSEIESDLGLFSRLYSSPYADSTKAKEYMRMELTLSFLKGDSCG